MSGSSTTVKQTTRALGPAMRMVVDLGNFGASVQNIAAGESGHVASSHYKDQWNAYYAVPAFQCSTITWKRRALSHSGLSERRWEVRIYPVPLGSALPQPLT